MIHSRVCDPCHVIQCGTGTANTPRPRVNALLISTHPCITGEIFTLWGRSACPSIANLVYAGVAANARNASVASVSILCLPLARADAPGEFNNDEDSVPAMVPLRYLTDNALEPDLRGLDGAEMPCAVCQLRDAGMSAPLVVPGTTVCPTNPSAGLTMTNAYSGSYDQSRACGCMSHYTGAIIGCDLICVSYSRGAGDGK